MKYQNIIEFQVYGRNALFADVLTRAGGEKSSYPVPTYEALKGILSSVYWKPTIIWKILDVRVMNPIYFERKGAKLIKYGNSKKTDLAFYTYLHDVRYQVRAKFEWNFNRPELESDRDEHKHMQITKKWIGRGGRRDVFLGTRECQAYVEPCVFGEGEGAYDHAGVIPFGLMEHGLTYPDEAIRDEDKGYLTLRLWRPVMENGIIHFPMPEECDPKLMRHIKQMGMETFTDVSEEDDE